MRIQLFADELHQPLRALPTQATVVLVGTLGGGGSPDDDASQHQSLVAQHGSNLTLVELYEGFVGTQLRTVDAETDTLGRSVEERVTDVGQLCLLVIADVNEGVFRDRHETAYLCPQLEGTELAEHGQQSSDGKPLHHGMF